MGDGAPLRVLLVSHEYPPFGVAGVERHTEATAAGLAERGHEVTVLTRRSGPAPPHPTLQREMRDGIDVLTLAGGGARSAAFPGGTARLERWFERVVVEVDPDVVLITHLLDHSPGIVAAAQRWGVPVVLELHDFFVICPRVHLERVTGEPCSGPDGGRACAAHCFPGDRDPELRWALRARSYAEAVRAADIVLTPSRFLAGRLQALRADCTPIEVVDNAVRKLEPSPGRRRSSGQPLTLASIGVTTEHKGFRVVVDALRLAKLPAARYTILGRTLPLPVRQLRSAAIEVPGLDLRLFDRFDPGQLPALLAEVDALVIPSLVPETFSIVAREAFACGVPVIASRIGALPDAIRDGDNGWLFDPGSAADLAALLQRLDRDRGLIDSAAAGIRPSDTVGVDERSERIEQLLSRAVSDGCHLGTFEAESDLRTMREALARADAEESKQTGETAPLPMPQQGT